MLFQFLVQFIHQGVDIANPVHLRLQRKRTQGGATASGKTIKSDSV